MNLITRGNHYRTMRLLMPKCFSNIMKVTAAFDAVIDGTNPFIVNVTDRSINAEFWDWDWGDGSAHSSGTTASHTYATAGVKTITLIASNLTNRDDAVETVEVTGLVLVAHWPGETTPADIINGLDMVWSNDNNQYQPPESYEVSSNGGLSACFNMRGGYLPNGLYSDTPDFTMLTAPSHSAFNFLSSQKLVVDFYFTISNTTGMPLYASKILFEKIGNPGGWKIHAGWHWTGSTWITGRLTLDFGASSMYYLNAWSFNVWHHVKVEYENGLWKLFLDDVELTPTNAPVSYGTGFTAIDGNYYSLNGTHGGDRGLWNHLIDEVKILKGV